MPPERSNAAALIDMLQAAQTVWRIGTKHIPELLRHLSALIPPPPPDPEPVDRA